MSLSHNMYTPHAIYFIVFTALTLPHTPATFFTYVQSELKIALLQTEARVRVKSKVNCLFYIHYKGNLILSWIGMVIKVHHKNKYQKTLPTHVRHLFQ